MISFPKSDDGVCCRAPATHPVNRRVRICSAQRQLYMFAHHQLSVANRLKNIVNIFLEGKLTSPQHAVPIT
jgi:hypothetical protein